MIVAILVDTAGVTGELLIRGLLDLERTAWKTGVSVARGWPAFEGQPQLEEIAQILEAIAAGIGARIEAGHAFEWLDDLESLEESTWLLKALREAINPVLRARGIEPSSEASHDRPVVRGW